MSQRRAEVNINPERVEYHPASKMYFPKDNSSVQCRRCGWVMSNQLTTCEKCGCPKLEPVSTKVQLDLPEKQAVAHFSREVEWCWAEEQDSESGQYSGHKLVMETRLVINIGYGEAHQEHYCSQCGLVYSWDNGRAATAQELADAKAGKIPLKQRNPAMIARVAG